jgi:hypothetical protein
VAPPGHTSIGQPGDHLSRHPGGKAATAASAVHPPGTAATTLPRPARSLPTHPRRLWATGSIPTKTHGSPLLVGDEVHYGHVDTFVATRCLHDLSKAVGASNLLLAQALMIHVLRGDQRRDQIDSTNVEDLDDLPGESFRLGHRAPLLADGQIVSVRSRASWTPIAVG